MDNLVIYQKVYDFTLYLFPVVDKFPKHEKFVLCTHIKSCVLDIARDIIRANKSRNKRPILYDIDVRIEEMKFLLRLAHDRKYYQTSIILLTNIIKYSIFNHEAIDICKEDRD